MSNQYDLSHRTVLITGASSGIGAQLARSFARSGASVVIAARRMEKLEALKAEFEAGGTRAVAVSMDVTDEASVISAFDTAEKSLGSIDTVVVNAGLMINAPALNLSVDDFDSVMAVNVRGAFLTAREGARRMIANGSAEKENGRVVLISSVGASKVLPTNAAYGTSKAAVRYLNKQLALEWINKGISVNAILPGMIRTEMTGGVLDSNQGNAFLSRLPRGREMDINALDNAILMLCSESSKWITGAEIIIDDGQNLMI